jgi:uncharacterized protein (DUF427 family)
LEFTGSLDDASRPLHPEDRREDGLLVETDRDSRCPYKGHAAVDIYIDGVRQ